MRPVSLLLVPLVPLLLSGCAPLSLYYKEGESVARMEQTQTACAVAARKDVPPDIRTRYIPPTYMPYQSCTANGQCHTHYRILTPGRVEQYDAAEALRGKVEGQCMAARGYARVSVPQCDAETTRATVLRATQTLPPLTRDSCAIRLKSGRWQIVTP